MANLLEEKKELTLKDVEAKLARLNSYIAKADRNIEIQEKVLEKIRGEKSKKLFKVKKGVIRGKIYG